MVTALRYTPQKQQELRSRFQLADRLTEFGWIPVVPEDLGEDFIVHIYHEWCATGVNFYVQVKSVTNLNGRRKGDYLPYSFAVKDLIHWEQFVLPVVLIIWDVKLQKGRWAMLNEIIQHLDRRYPNWRTQKTKTVYIPWQNNTNEDSLVRLRHEIGIFFYPQIFKDKTVEIKSKIKFPNTEDGRKELQAFERALKEGEPGTWEVQLELPQKLAPWFGGPIIENAELIKQAVASDKSYPTSITAYDLSGDATTLIFELRVEKLGTDSVTIANHHQNTFLHFLLVFVSGEMESAKATITINDNAQYLGRTAFEAKNVLRFLNSMARRGKLRIDLETKDSYSFEAEIPIAKRLFFSPPRDFVNLVDKLCTIENKFGNPIKVPFEGPSSQDAQVIEDMFEIIRFGKRIRKNQEVTINFVYQQALGNILSTACQKKNIQVSATHPEMSLDLLEDNFQLGDVVQFISGKPVLLNETDFIANLKPGERFELKIQESTVEELFPQFFLEEAERISRLLASEFGIKSIYLFGSLAWGETFTPDTDVDLAVSGIEPEKIYKAIGYLEGETKFPFDLINLDEAPPSLRERILKEGKLLYECEPVAVGG